MSTDTDTAQTGGFSSEYNEDVYRPVAQMAVVSFVFAVAGILAFASPFFWPVAFVALIISIWTSASLEKARREYAGQLLTKIAVVIALTCSVAAPTRYYVTKFIIVRQARAFSDEFLDLILANRVKDAFVLTIAPFSRAGMESDPDELIRRSSEQFREFLNKEVYTNLAGRLEDAQVTYVDAVGYHRSQGYYGVLCKYRVAMDDRIYRVNIVPRGGEAPFGEWQGRKWYIYDVQLSVE